jgi:hypothetical protein
LSLFVLEKNTYFNAVNFFSLKKYIGLCFLFLYQLGLCQDVLPINKTKNRFQFDSTNQTSKVGFDTSYYILDLKKISPLNHKKDFQVIKMTDKDHAIVKVKVENVDTFKDYIKQTKGNNWKWYSDESINKKSFPYTIYMHAINNSIISKFIPDQTALDAILKNPNIIGIEQVMRAAKTEFNLIGQDFSLNGFNKVKSLYPYLQGNGVKVSIKEELMDTNDVDLLNRYTRSSLAAKILNPHASIMSTIISGAGNSYQSGQGIAPKLIFTSSSYDSLQPNNSSILNNEKTFIQNHSYGVGIENYYGADASAYDLQTFQNQNLLHVFSAGNSGNKTSTSGNYANLAHVANLTGNFKLSKNVLTVGATDSFNILETRSSRGPAYDGRIKPDIAAFGQDGTSGAAALVSGLSALCYELYKIKTSKLPSSALIRSAIITGADRETENNINFKSGFGILNAVNTVTIINQQNYFEDSILHLQTKILPLTVPNNLKSLKITLVWHDTNSNISSAKALVNDLDLELRNISNNIYYKPWVLNSFPNIDSLSLPATRKKDTLNNVEQISIALPNAGNYQLIVKASKVVSQKQKYAITYRFDTLETFTFNYPCKTDQLIPNEKQLLRWQSNLNDSIAKLFVSYDLGLSWHLLKDTLLLNSKALYFKTKDTNCLVIFKAEAGSKTFYSDTIRQAEIITPKVIYICGDSALISWRKVQNSSQYTVSNLGSQYLQVHKITVDTFISVNTTVVNLNRLAIAPTINNTICKNSYLYQYKEQGVSCYFSNFLAGVFDEDKAKIDLQISSTANAKAIAIEKFDGKAFKPIYSNEVRDSTHFEVLDLELFEGKNIYRAEIILKNNQSIFSDESEILFIKEKPFLIFPNPLTKNDVLNVWNLKEDIFYVNIYNALGKIVYAKSLKSNYNQLNDLKLNRGIYFIEVANETKTIIKKKLIVI